MNFSRFARYLLALLVSAGLAAPMAYAYDKDKGKDKAKGKAKHEDKHKDKDPITGGHDRDDDRDDDDDNDGNGGMRFRGMDRNGDGRITRREWRGNDNSFRNHDCNNDGVLSGEEVRPGGKCAQLPPIVRNPPITRRNPPITRRNPIIEERTTRFRQMDVDRNGFVYPAEWAAGSRSDFDVLDRNNDGRLSLDEFVHRRS